MTIHPLLQPSIPMVHHHDVQKHYLFQMCFLNLDKCGIVFINLHPCWPNEQSMSSAAAQVPWDSVAPFHSLPAQPSLRTYLFRPDVFHCWHLGHGRYFASSALALLQVWEPGTSVDTRLQSLTQKWLAYCRARKVPCQHCQP